MCDAALYAPATNDGERTGLSVGSEHSQNIRYKRAYGIELLVRHGKHKQCNTHLSEVLLMMHVAVTGNTKAD